MRQLGCGLFAGLLLGLFAGAGCGKVARDLSRLSCDQGRCGSDYSCDTVTNLCVTTGDLCDAEDRTSDCGDGQARMCESGVWSSCAPLGDECAPATAICDGNNLIVCDGRGYYKEARGCGTAGCNALASPPRCNVCVPNSRTCDNLIFTLCAADGLIASREDCRTGTDCSGAGTCVPATGCGVEAQAPDGRACDEGEGQNGNYCDSQCESGVCVAERTPTCDDQAECTNDSCVPTAGCVFANRPANDPCAGGDMNLCNSSCDGAGNCVPTPVDCDAVGLCARCDPPTGGCTVAAAPATICRPVADLCDIAEQCDGDSLACPADVLYGAETVCRPVEGPCDVEDRCSGTSPACPDVLAEPTKVCHASTGTCDPAERCTSGTTMCPSDVFSDDGTTCSDCPGGAPCDASGCEQGLCPDLCDGEAAALACSALEDCATCRSAVECEALACVGGVAAVPREHQACADSSDSTNWGSAQPCVSVTCENEDSNNGPDAIGGDCFGNASSNDAQTTQIRYTFNTRTPTNTTYNVWMRNIADNSWGAGEQYNCTLSGVGGGVYAFSFVEGDLDNYPRHGTGCGDFDHNSRYCWMAVDGDSTRENGYQALSLDRGEHLLECTFTSNGDVYEDAGFDGILFTTDLGFIPAESGTSAVCGDEDWVFTAADCSAVTTVNWGPNNAASPEHFACADIADAASFGVSKPCVAVFCQSETDPRPAGATNRVGSDCYGANQLVQIRYEFQTSSANDVPFNLWLRNAVDADWAGEEYICQLRGVAGVTGSFEFRFAESDLDNYSRHGSGCGDYGNSPKYCWMAADRDSTRNNGYQPFYLEPGSHVLTCEITLGGANRHAGFDGIVVTSDLDFVPDERNGPVACNNSDAVFSAGNCNWQWGRNLAPIEETIGRCQIAPIANGIACGGSNVCCEGVCQASCP